jgi:hypothetical protein
MIKFKYLKLKYVEIKLFHVTAFVTGNYPGRLSDLLFLKRIHSNRTINEPEQ